MNEYDLKYVCTRKCAIKLRFYKGRETYRDIGTHIPSAIHGRIMSSTCLLNISKKCSLSLDFTFKKNGLCDNNLQILC